MIIGNLFNEQMGSFKSLMEYVSKCGWNLDVYESGDNWFVMGGEKVLLQTDNYELVEVFIYSMGLGMKAISKVGYERLMKTIE